MSLQHANAIKRLSERLDALEQRVAELEAENQSMHIEMAQFARKRGRKPNGDETQTTFGQ